MNVILALLLAAPTLLSPKDGAVVPTHTELQKSYLQMMPREERIAKFADKDFRKRLAVKKVGWYPLPTELTWKADGECEVKVARKRDGKVVFTEKNATGKTKIDNLEIACEYVWFVKDADGAASATFVTEDEAPRLIRVPHVPNVRDLGGRIGLDGRRVKQNLVFRSAGLNDNANQKKQTIGKTRIRDDNRDYLLNTLCIKSDIDLRSDGECWGMQGSPLGPTVTWFHYSSGAYGGMQEAYGRSAFTKVFKVFLDEKNYPIDFHCIAGQDRTGAVAFILNGLLGVKEEQLYLDWEATGFWNSDIGFSHAKRFNKLVEGFEKKYPEGKTINEKVELYVKSLGFTDADIAKFREIMLEK